MGDRVKNVGRRLRSAALGALNGARAAFPSLLVTAGLILLSYGVATIYTPAGFVAAGAITMLLGIGVMRR